MREAETVPLDVVCAEAFAVNALVTVKTFADVTDTLAAIAKYGVESRVGYISTVGGVFLKGLEGKTLLAFEILKKHAADLVAIF